MRATHTAVPALYRSSEASTDSLMPCAARTHAARGPSTLARRCARPSEARRARPLAARARAGRAPHAPRRLAEPSVAVKGRGAAQRARDPEAEVVPPRSEAQRDKASPGYGNAALPDSDRRAPRAGCSARDRWEAGRDPRARALPSARRLHHFRRSAAGRILGPLRTSREPRSKQLKEDAPARRVTLGHSEWTTET